MKLRPYLIGSAILSFVFFSALAAPAATQVTPIASGG